MVLLAYITRHEFVSEAEFDRIAARNLSQVLFFACFCLIKETNERYFLRFTQHKVSSNVNKKNDKRFNSRGYSSFYLMGFFLEHL